MLSLKMYPHLNITSDLIFNSKASVIDFPNSDSVNPPGIAKIRYTLSPSSALRFFISFYHYSLFFKA